MNIHVSPRAEAALNVPVMQLGIIVCVCSQAACKHTVEGGGCWRVDVSVGSNERWFMAGDGDGERGYSPMRVFRRGNIHGDVSTTCLESLEHLM